MSYERMHSVLPSSGIGGGRITVGGGGRLSDRELLSSVSDQAAIQSMLRNTPFPGRTGLGGVPVALPAALVRAMGRPGRVPSVAQAVRRSVKMIDAVPKAVIEALDMPDLVPVAMRQDTRGVPVIPGFTYQAQCPYVLGTTFNGGNWALSACATGYVQRTFSETMAILQARGTLESGFYPLSTTPHLIQPTQRRARFFYRKPAGSVTRGPSYAVAEKALVNAMALPSNRNMTSTRRRTTKPDLPGYRKPAVDINVKAGRNGGITYDGPPTKTTHREVPTNPKREKKTKKKVGALIGAYHKLTEINDLVDALADAIPGNPCKGLPGFRKLVCVVDHWDEIDPAQAALNVAYNEIEDRIVGRLQGRLSDALKKAGGPNSTQVQQYVRQLNQMTKGVI